MDRKLKLDLNWKKILAIMLLVFVSFFSGLVVYHFYNAGFQIKEKTRIEKQFLKDKLLAEKQEKNEEKIKQKKINSIFSNFLAKSVLIKELDGKVIYSKNVDSILPIASLTKIINAIIALRTKTAETPVIMTARSLKSEGEYGIHAYETFKLNDALRYMLIGSVNDIASAISFGSLNFSKNWEIFLKEMNEFTKNNSMNSTLFFSENGLDITPHIMGAYSTSNDIAKIVEYFYDRYNSLAKETVKVEDNICSNEYCHYVKNTNLVLEKYPEIQFSKTGYTKMAGGSVAVVVEVKGKDYIIVILDSTKEGRFDDLEIAIKGLKEYLK